MPKELTLAEAGDRLGLSSVTLRRQVGRGKLKARLVGKTWVVTEREVARYAAESLGKRRRRRHAAASDAK
jgi:predicted site-specific integrase-resolvase